MISIALLLLASPFSTIAEAPQSSGVWQSQGYGYVLELRDGQPTLYHQAGDLCIKDPRGGDPEEQFRVYQEVTPERANFAGEAGGTRYIFDRLPALPAACAKGNPLTPQQKYDFVIGNLRAWYPLEARGVDLDKAVNGIGPIVNDTDLWTALTRVYGVLDDTHSEVHADERTFTTGEADTLERIGDVESQKAWLRSYRDGVLNDILLGQGHQVGNKRVFWGVNDDIGYINIMTMGAFDGEAEDYDTGALDTILDEAMSAFQGKRAVIVDLGNNRGGYDRVAQVIAPRFADQQRLAYTRGPAGSPQTEPQSVYAVPSQRPRFLGPVYVLTSDITVSAGETGVLLLKALPNVVQVGTTTRGALSDQITKPLGDGWDVTMSAEIYRDPSGFVPEGKGIAPDVVLDLYGPQGHAAAVLGLMERIRVGDPSLKRR
ncbi:peptidase family S41 family protein [Asticcacaulis biprosthecium C19]|uniref:Peptidase family S41 family protein n=1 Tax=Asticcacaulis biprosthecium C19 TaxID=715226 RepID=F4QHI1_9CAUL|nr:S41 family peptidase [Asticcacaulis biprosthecium]EGF92718.1 peptidase family S41 family protein [Asticcacaulis biprosthecium C19]